MTSKVRKIDLHADEFLAAVSGEMSPAELGVYWMICLLVYSRGGRIDHDLDWLRRKFKPAHGLSIIAPIINSLIQSGRVESDGRAITVRRCSEELARAQRRISDAVANGERGGRVRSKNKAVEEATLLCDGKLTLNQEPRTKNEEDSEADASAAASAAVPQGGNVSQDPIKALWDAGLELMTNAGVTDKQARTMIGKWRREFGDAACMAAFATAKNELATEPISFISACLQNSRNARNGTNGHGRKLTPSQAHSLAGLQYIWDANREEDLRDEISVARRDTS